MKKQLEKIKALNESIIEELEFLGKNLDKHIKKIKTLSNETIRRLKNE